MFYFGTKTSWETMAHLLPNASIRLFGVQISRVWIGFIVRVK